MTQEMPTKGGESWGNVQVTLADGSEMRISGHAVDRYHEYIRPALLRREALDEMVRLLRIYGYCEEQRPQWATIREQDAAADAWVHMNDDVVFPVRHGILTTCRVRGTVSPEQRAAKKRDRQWRQRKRRGTQK
jgi:hypothetical protein